MFKKFNLLLMLIFLSFSSFSSHAGEVFLKNEMIEKTNKLLEVVKVINDSTDMSESEIYNLLDKELGKVFAFRRMAGRVMGRYARSATKNERDLFVDNFKSKLFDTYVDNLRKSEGVTAVVKDARLLTNDENRGVVSLSVSDSSKESFNVSYSVFKSEDQWMVENLIIEGVNMGLAFRDSFYQEMEKNRNNIKKSIKDWGVKSDLINN